MKPVIDHIEITVKDMEVAVPFYDQLMPILGFDLRYRSRARFEEKEFDVVEYYHPNLGFAINSPRSGVADDDVHRRRPGSVHHIAFRAESRDEVDRVHEQVKEIGAVITHPPQLFEDYVPPGYYACFFKDLEGIKYEIVHAPTDGWDPLRKDPSAAG